MNGECFGVSRVCTNNNNKFELAITNQFKYIFVVREWIRALGAFFFFTFNLSTCFVSVLNQWFDSSAVIIESDCAEW